MHLSQLCHLCNYTSMRVAKSQQAVDRIGTLQEVINFTFSYYCKSEKTLEKSFVFRHQ